MADKIFSMERFNPLNDYLFLKVMGEPGDEEQCIAFINAVLADSTETPLRLVEIIENRSISSENRGDKSVVLDLRALAETDTQKNIKVNIEVQLKDFHNMTERTLYYWAREYVSGIKEGDDYSELPRVITINIVNFDHVKIDKYHTAFRLREDTYREYVLTDMLEVHFLNMVKYRKKAVKDMSDPLERWLTFFDERASERELTEVLEMDAVIQKAQTRLQQVTRENEYMHQETRRLMALSDWTSMRNTAIEEGMAKGIEKERLDVAKRAISKGVSIEIIQELTGLKADDIISLQNGK
jgi:predicted transposase/invertase (TIGR01784 family)